MGAHTSLINQTRAYRHLNVSGFVHSTVNRQNFVDPGTGIHTRGKERLARREEQNHENHARHFCGIFP